MACVSTALIVGGGIAGLSAAIALSRAGVRCEVVEVSGVPLGASIGISGRAAEAMVELGIYDEVHRTGMPFGPDSTALTQWDAAGKMIGPGPKRPNWPGAVDGVAVYRPVFIGIMAETARSLGATIRTGVTAREIVNGPDAVTVTFTDGETKSYDLLIGADGIGSKTRAMLFPDAPTPQYAGQMSIRWMSPGPDIADAGWYNGPVGRLGFYHLPVQGLMYTAAVIDMPAWQRMSEEEVYALFARLLDSYTAPAIVALRKRLAPGQEIIGRPFEWVFMPAPWHTGRALLIGDAAHATTSHMGMGGGMALEDSVVLGQCVAAACSLPEALDAFMARRFDRVRIVVETSLKLCALEQAKAPPPEKIAALTAALMALGQPY